MRKKDYTPQQKKSMALMAKWHIENHPIDNLIKVIEELSELNRELCKYILFKNGRLPTWSPEDLLGELFDADFMILQAKTYFLETLHLADGFGIIAHNKSERKLARWGLK